MLIGMLLVTLKMLGIAGLYMLLQMELTQLLMRYVYTPLAFADAMLLSQVASLLALALVMAVVVRLLCRTPLRTLGGFRARGGLKHWLFGLGLGAGSVALVWAVIVLGGGYAIQAQAVTPALLGVMGLNLLTMLLVGYNEELLCRGVMAFVGRGAGRGFAALATGVVFSLMHLLNPSYRVLSMVNTLLIALALSMMTWLSGDLWLAIGFHTAWNFVMSSGLGVEVSGLVTAGLLRSLPQSQGLLTGGSYGLEASLVCTAFCLLLIAALWWQLHRGRQNPQPVAAWLAAPLWPPRV